MSYNLKRRKYVCVCMYSFIIKKDNASGEANKVNSNFI